MDIHSIGSFLVPLLHFLIQFGNDILNIFKDIVNKKIEELTPNAITVRSGLVTVEKKLNEPIDERNQSDVLDCEKSGRR